VHWALVAFALAAIVTRSHLSRGPALAAGPACALAALGVFAGAAWMATAASRFVWEATPLLALLQFPWRFLTLAAFGASLAGGFAIDGLIAPERGRARVLAAGGAILSAVLAYGAYAQPRFAVYDRERNAYVHAAADEARALLRDPARYQDVAERATLATLVATGQSGTSRHEYVPTAVNRLPPRASERKAQLLGSGRIEQAETLGPNRERFRVTLDEGGDLRFQQFFFPGWRATVDGARAPLRVEFGSGLILVALPAGAHLIELEFRSTPLRQAAGAVSLAALIAALAAAGASALRSRGRPPQAAPQPGRYT
jgi:hypothetical protein